MWGGKQRGKEGKKNRWNQLKRKSEVKEKGTDRNGFKMDNKRESLGVQFVEGEQGDMKVKMGTNLTNNMLNLKH